MSQRLFDGWQRYKAILPKDAGAVQIEETRRAFYAGAAVCLSAVLEAADAPDSENEDEGVKVLEEIAEEISGSLHDMRAIE